MFATLGISNTSLMSIDTCDFTVLVVVQGKCIFIKYIFRKKLLNLQNLNFLHRTLEKTHVSLKELLR